MRNPTGKTGFVARPLPRPIEAAPRDPRAALLAERPVLHLHDVKEHVPRDHAPLPPHPVGESSLFLEDPPELRCEGEHPALVVLRCPRIDEIKDAGVPVIVHPTMCRATGETENLSFETAATLKAAGIPIALQSGYESYVPRTRVVLFEAGVAAAHGLDFEEALGTITIEAATILGIANRVGSLEVGKDADVALFDGDPFEYTTHCIGVIANGEVVSQEVR